VGCQRCGEMKGGHYSHSSNANADFQDSSNVNANRSIYFVSRYVMHWFTSIK